MTSLTDLRTKLEELYRQLLALEGAYRTQKIAFFRPNPASAGQKQFFKDQTALIRLCLGDNRSGKSVCGVNEAISHSLGYRPWLPEGHPDYIVRLNNGKPIPVPNMGKIIAQDYQQAIRQNIWPKIQEWAPRGWYKVRKDNRGIPVEIIWKNGSVIYLMSDDQDDDVFEGTAYHWFWADEPIGYRKYTALKRGLIDFGGHCWLTLTPLTQPWIADVIEAKANDPDGQVRAYRFSIYENIKELGGHLDPEAIEGFVSDLRPEEKAVRVGGQWAHLTGRVFKEWLAVPPFWVEPSTLPLMWPRICVIDPHPNKPIAVMWVAINPDNQKFVYRELWDESLRTVADVAKRMKEDEAGEPIAMRLIDPSSHEKERTSGKSVRTKFHECGIWTLPAPKKNINAGLDDIHAALKIQFEWGEPNLVVFNTCPTVKRNFLRFVWDDYRNTKDRDIKGPRQEARKTDDDFIAGLRYIYQSGVTYDMLRRELSVQEDPIDLPHHRGVNVMTGEASGRHFGSAGISEIFTYPE